MNTTVKFTIPISYDKPNNNGVIMSKEAVKKALNNLSKRPIALRDEVWKIGRVVGTTLEGHKEEWDDKNGVCKLTIDCIIFDAGLDITVQKMVGNTITEFTPSCLCISKK